MPETIDLAEVLELVEEDKKRTVERPLPPLHVLHNMKKSELWEIVRRMNYQNFDMKCLIRRMKGEIAALQAENRQLFGDNAMFATAIGGAEARAMYLEGAGGAGRRTEGNSA